jgi:hypothetical protein
MGKTHVNFKLSDDALNILLMYKSEQHLDILTDALERLLREFWKNRQKPLNRFKRLLAPDPNTRSLEVFTSGS